MYATELPVKKTNNGFSFCDYSKKERKKNGGSEGLGFVGIRVTKLQYTIHYADRTLLKKLLMREKKGTLIEMQRAACLYFNRFLTRANGFLSAPLVFLLLLLLYRFPVNYRSG